MQLISTRNFFFTKRISTPVPPVETMFHTKKKKTFTILDGKEKAEKEEILVDVHHQRHQQAQQQQQQQEEEQSSPTVAGKPKQKKRRSWKNCKPELPLHYLKRPSHYLPRKCPL